MIEVGLNMVESKIVKKTVADIKSLKIQGATKIREKAVVALVNSVELSKAKTPAHFRSEFLKNATALFYARPTEPALRTAILILKKSISQKDLSVFEMKTIIQKTAESYEKDRQNSLKAIANYGASMIKKNSNIMVHCHSHSVMDMLKKAKKKINIVYCTETRPLYQGRISAKELGNAGLNTIMIIDSATSTVMKDCDYFFTGADAILADGDLINKIGTNQISIVAEKYHTPHYALCSTHKFEPSTFFGKEEPIEQRSVKEIWDKKPKHVKIKNPSFDRTDSNLVEGIISELGVMPPEQFAAKLYDKLNLSKHHEDFLKM